MGIINTLRLVASAVDLYSYSPTAYASHSGNTLYKGSSTKKGGSPKAIKARRKKNKNKKTHRK